MDRRLQFEVTESIAVVRYPEICSGSPFTEDYARASAQLRRQTKAVALLHDLRGVSVTKLDSQLVLSDAREVAAGGRVRCVAFVLDCNPFWQSVITAMVSKFSPVQPSRVFGDVRAAREWCRQCLLNNAGGSQPNAHARPMVGATTLSASSPAAITRQCDGRVHCCSHFSSNLNRMCDSCWPWAWQ
ncbi:hypothetical protein AB1Y20_013043 [Prymnesium parvum]|uniref:STAS/SEC14 domain-containing protein n=1 Tax=Prymnesium parvum TaxID=97485 RepID=A0AB34IME8_PRYPA